MGDIIIVSAVRTPIGAIGETLKNVLPEELLRQEGIILKQGRTLASLAKELERQAKAKMDYLVDTRLMQMETAGGTSCLTIPVNGIDESLPIGDIAARQIADWLKIPGAYYDRMKAELPDLLDQNVSFGCRFIFNKRQGKRR